MKVLEEGKTKKMALRSQGEMKVRKQFFFCSLVRNQLKWEKKNDQSKGRKHGQVNAV